MGKNYSKVPIIDMSHKEAPEDVNPDKTNEEMIENIIDRIPNSLIEKISFVWVRKGVDRSTLDFLKDSLNKSLEGEHVYGAIIPDPRGDCLELYWENILKPAKTSNWWKRAWNVKNPVKTLSLFERCEIVIYDIFRKIAKAEKMADEEKKLRVLINSIIEVARRRNSEKFFYTPEEFENLVKKGKKSRKLTLADYLEFSSPREFERVMKLSKISKEEVEKTNWDLLINYLLDCDW